MLDIFSLQADNEQEKAAITIPRFKPLPKAKVGKQVEVIDPSPFTAKRKLAIGLGGVGVVGVGVGVWLYVTAKGQYDDAKAEPDDVKQKSLWDSANQKYLIAQIAGGVGVAALGTAAFLWFTGKPAIVERPELAITPSIGPGGAVTPPPTGSAVLASHRQCAMGKPCGSAHKTSPPAAACSSSTKDAKARQGSGGRARLASASAAGRSHSAHSA